MASTMVRQFVHMVTYSCNRGIYGLHRINPSRFFHPKDAAVGRPATAVEDVRLPRPAMSFSRPYETHIIPTEFMPLGRNNDKIVSVDETGRSILYDVASHAISTLPGLKAEPKFGCCVSLNIGDNLYVMQENPCRAQCFEALVYCKSPKSDEEQENRWSWRPQPPPPYLHSVGYHCSGGDITAYAVVGDSHILVSTESYGTYSFDTVSSEWSKAGDWALPFNGRAEYVPEHGLWFGFSASDDGLLGAWDLSTVVTQQQPPVAHVLQDGFSVPEGFSSFVVHLGAGNLCVAKLFEKARRETSDQDCYLFETTRRFAMLTGVEVQRRGEELNIIKHRSSRYSFGLDKIPSSVF
jgi:hypothetical protein